MTAAPRAARTALTVDCVTAGRAGAPWHAILLAHAVIRNSRRLTRS
jgi:hypothetical protein